MAQLLKDEKHVAECVSEAMISRSEVWTGDQMRAACSVLAAQDSRSIDLIVDRLPAETWAVLLDHAGSQQSRLHRSIYHFVMERTDDDPVRIGLVLQLLKECDDPKARAEGASMLGRANASHVTITPALLHAGLHDPDRSVRAAALLAAESRRDADTQLVAALIEALNDPSPEVVLAGANSLARLGPRAAAANEALVAAADHPDASARDAIADAIRKTKPAGAP
jgi:HEAT repeat protein